MGFDEKQESSRVDELSSHTGEVNLSDIILAWRLAKNRWFGVLVIAGIAIHDCLIMSCTDLSTGTFQTRKNGS
jgi:hypothetical protein